MGSGTQREPVLKITYNLDPSHCIHLKEGNGFGGNPNLGWGGCHGFRYSLLLWFTDNQLTTDEQ